MSKEKKEELLITQELVNKQRAYTEELEKGAGIKEKNRIFTKEILNVSRELSAIAFEELQFAKESNNSIRSRSELLAAQAKQKTTTEKLMQQYRDMGIKSQAYMSTEEGKAFQRKKSTIIQEIVLSKKLTDGIDKQIEKRAEIISKNLPFSKTSFKI